MEFQFVRDRADAGWATAVDLVTRRYARTYGADIAPDPDLFVTLSRGGRMLACSGLTGHGLSPSANRPGPVRRFFSELYLPGPFDQLVEQRSGTAVDRRRVVEVSALATERPGAGRELVRALPILAWCQGFSHLLCTVTTDLVRLFARMGIPFEPLATADISVLPAAERAQWGSYYDARPCTGYIPLDRISAMFADSTGRYAFNPVRVRVDADADRAAPSVLVS